MKFTDPGATAIDNVDGDISNSITVSGDVNTKQAGTYEITYTVEDAMENQASIKRTVIVESYILLEDFEDDRVIVLITNRSNQQGCVVFIYCVENSKIR